MFITELNLYINYLEEKLASLNPGLNVELKSFIESLQDGIEYYRSKACQWFNEEGTFLFDLFNSELMLKKIILKYNG